MSFDTHRARHAARRHFRSARHGCVRRCGAPVVRAATPTLETVTVTAQRRETDLQTTPVAISAYGGEALVENKIFTVNDLANNVPAFSLTALTPLDAELNIRGITNTRLDSPTADPSVGTFVDGVYMGRTGDLQLRLLRPRAHRGHPRPAGRAARQERGGRRAQRHHREADVRALGQRAGVSYGNYNSMLVSGFVNGGLNDSWAGRVSFQGRKHDGYAEDVLHHRDVEDLESYQAPRAVAVRPGRLEIHRPSRARLQPRRDQRHQHGRGRGRHDARARPRTCARTARDRGATCARISVSPIRARTSRRASSTRASRASSSSWSATASAPRSICE